MANKYMKRYLLLGRKVMINLESILKSRDLTFPTKVCLVKAMVFLVVITLNLESHALLTRLQISTNLRGSNLAILIQVRNAIHTL